MSSISLVISEKDNKLKSALSLMLHNSYVCKNPGFPLKQNYLHAKSLGMI